MSLPTIGITCGDPSGIGPEIAVKATHDPRVVSLCRPVLYGPHAKGDVSRFPIGRVSAESGKAAYAAIEAATRDAMDKKIAAIVTAPINKAAFAEAGYPWRGHTDLLAHLCGVRDVAMMFWSDRLRVVLATVHIPLREVAAALTHERWLEVLRLTARSLPRFGFASPRRSPRTPPCRIQRSLDRSETATRPRCCVGRRGRACTARQRADRVWL